MSDLYKTLQVPTDADETTIKKAYRRLAKLYHPDRHRDATESEMEKAQELFRQVKQAYEVLGTEERRKLYDRYGDIALNPNFKGFQDDGENASRDFNSFFSDFGNMNNTSGGTRQYEGSYRKRTTVQDEQDREKRRRQQSNSWGSREYSERTQGQSFTERFNSGNFERPFSQTDFDDFQRRYTRSSNTTPEDPFFGLGTGSNRTSQNSNRSSRTQQKTRSSQNTQKRVQTTRQNNSPQKGSDIHLTIKIEFRDAIFGTKRKVSINRPLRWVPSSVAPAKTPMENFDVAVSIPVGIENGEEIRISDKGNPGRNGGKHGDLVIHVEILPHPYFYRQGSDVFMNVPLSLQEALYGTSLVVPTPSNTSLRIQIPPRIKNGQKLRLKDRGLPKMKKGNEGIVGGNGDLFLIIRVVLPEGDDPLLEQKLKSIADELSAFYPSEGVRKDWKI
jgi:DnaJ-class molecular chaperone